MLLQYITYLILGSIAAVIGALPFGLVNLSVLRITIEEGQTPAINTARGAALVEVIYGIIAFTLGSYLSKIIGEVSFVNYIIIAISFAVGIVFLLKRRQIKSEKESHISGFVKGIFLNLISLQVFLFWIFATAFLISRQLMDSSFISIVIFAVGIWIGKMTVLWIYSLLSKKIVSKSQLISNNMNRIIGVIMLIIGIIQIFKL